MLTTPLIPSWLPWTAFGAFVAVVVVAIARKLWTLRKK